jgi:hypothetical protein
MFHSLCFIGSAKKFANLKFANSHTSEACGFAIADGAQEFADFKQTLAGPPMQNDKTKEKFKINTRMQNVSTQQLALRNTCYTINEAVPSCLLSSGACGRLRTNKPGPQMRNAARAHIFILTKEMDILK